MSADLDRAITDFLQPRDQLVVRMRLGLHDGTRYTLEEIGQRRDMSRERVRQLEERAKRRLRQRGIDLDSGKVTRHEARVPTPAPWVERARKRHPRAYEPWSNEDDSRVAEMFESGMPAEEIASLLERSAGGIAARLVRLGLLENRQHIALRAVAPPSEVPTESEIEG